MDAMSMLDMCSVRCVSQQCQETMLVACARPDASYLQCDTAIDNLNLLEVHWWGFHLQDLL